MSVWETVYLCKLRRTDNFKSKISRKSKNYQNQEGQVKTSSLQNNRVEGVFIIGAVS